VETDRVQAFSDGVFAFAITVLVLAITVPAEGTSLGAELLRLWPSYVAYFMSFVVIGAIWINHHAMFRHIVRADSWILIFNLLQLLVIAFLPFPTAVLARAFLDNADEQVATAFYGGTLAVLGAVICATWAYASRDHYLLDDKITPEKARRLMRRYLIGPVFYGIATVVGLIVPWLAVLIFAGLDVFFLLPQPSRRRPIDSEGGA
jgi:uncharacterized membrane protein